MKLLQVILVLLDFHGVCAAEEVRLNIRILPIASAGGMIDITLFGDVLTTKQGDHEAKIIRLKPQEAKRLWAAVEESAGDSWNGFWASAGYLDGYLIAISLDRGKKSLTFKGSNDCPPGFANVLKLIGEQTKIKSLSTSWKDMKESAKATPIG